MSEIRATTISDAAGTGPISLTGQSGAKVTCRYNHGTNTIDKSLNISSLTDSATGFSRLTFTSAMEDAVYTMTTMSAYVSTSNKFWACMSDHGGLGTTNTASTAELVQTYGDQNEEHFWDTNRGQIAIFGDLA